MTGRSGDATNISTRIARGGDHYAITSRSGWSPRATSLPCQLVTIHRVTAPESEQTTPAKSTTWPSPTTNFVATQHDSLATRLLDRDGLATKDQLACLKRQPAMKGL